VLSPRDKQAQKTKCRMFLLNDDGNKMSIKGDYLGGQQEGEGNGEGSGGWRGSYTHVCVDTHVCQYVE
jgi:hypothetical protein